MIIEEVVKSTHEKKNHVPEHLGSPSVMSQYSEKSHWPLAPRANIATLPSASATTQREAHDTIARIASFSFTLGVNVHIELIKHLYVCL